MHKIKTEEYYNEIDKKVREEVQVETLTNLMKAIYNAGFRDGSKDTKKDVDIIYEVISDILDSEVQLINNKEDKESIEEELTNYLVTLSRANTETLNSKYLDSMSRDYNILTRYIKLLNIITNTKEQD